MQRRMENRDLELHEKEEELFLQLEKAVRLEEDCEKVGINDFSPNTNYPYNSILITLFFITYFSSKAHFCCLSSPTQPALLCQRPFPRHTSSKNPPNRPLTRLILPILLDLLAPNPQFTHQIPLPCAPNLSTISNSPSHLPNRRNLLPIYNPFRLACPTQPILYFISNLFTELLSTNRVSFSAILPPPSLTYINC